VRLDWRGERVLAPIVKLVPVMAPPEKLPVPVKLLFPN